MFRWFVLAFVVVPLVELYLLVWMSAAIGFWQTVAIAIVTGVVGGNLARSEGLRVWRDWNLALQSGQVPESGVVDGMLILVGGALLFTPGVLTDTTGFALLFPITRRPLSRWLSSRVQLAVSSRVSAASPVGPISPRAARATVVDTTGIETTDVESTEVEISESSLASNTSADSRNGAKS